MPDIDSPPSRRWTWAYFLLPVGMALASLWSARAAEVTNFASVLADLFGSLCFFALPQAVWLGLASATRASGNTRHAGLLAASLALLAVWALAVWGPRDPSGLPFAWLLYWPLCIAGLVVVGLGAWIASALRTTP